MTDNGAVCGGLYVCQNGACTCPPQNTCGMACVDKTTNNSHCGVCNNACPAPSTCMNGQCQCPMGASICNGKCVDTKSDPLNCGGCGNTCAPGYACQNSLCVCPATPCGLSCVDTMTDPNNCGACNFKCPANATCQAGSCQCNAPLTQCGGVCVDTMTDPKNCGMCNTNCSSCQSGTCINCPTPDLFILQDLSGSMTTTTPSGSTRLQITKQAITNFLGLGTSTGFGMGIGYFPVPDSLTECTGVYPSNPVSIALLPGNGTAISSSLNAQIELGSTPQTPALQGALTYVRSFLQANVNHKAAVVMITDGLDNICSTTTPPEASTITVAQTFALGSPPVKTYVISIGSDNPAASWNNIAAAGGTVSAFPTNSALEIQNALNSIRAQFTQCN